MKDLIETLEENIKLNSDMGNISKEISNLNMSVKILEERQDNITKKLQSILNNMSTKEKFKNKRKITLYINDIRDVNGPYGSSNLFRLSDDDDNQYSFFLKGDYDYDVGDEIKVEYHTKLYQAEYQTTNLKGVKIV